MLKFDPRFVQFSRMVVIGIQTPVGLCLRRKSRSAWMREIADDMKISPQLPIQFQA